MESLIAVLDKHIQGDKEERAIEIGVMIPVEILTPIWKNFRKKEEKQAYIIILLGKGIEAFAGFKAQEAPRGSH